jgi:hypothetical protein
MYRALLRVQWKTSAPMVLFMALMAFAVPLVQLAMSSALAMSGDPDDASYILGSQATTAGLYPVAAYFLGFIIAATTWSDDTAGKHIYALSLPVPRWYYLLLRLGTGLTLMLVPVAALGLAALIAVSQVQLPAGIHAYPGGLTVRFALAAGLAFTLAFAAGSASVRTMRRAGIALLILVVAVVIVGALGFDSVAETAFQRLLRWPSFVDAFTGRWLLLDV